MSYASGRLAAAMLVVACRAALAGSQAHAAVVPRQILKSYFQTGDKPTAQQFENLIDSSIHETDDGLTLYAIGSSNKSTGPVALNLGKNVGINETLPDTVLHVWRPVAQLGGDSVAPMCDEFCGTDGFLPLQYRSTAGEFHYGFLQIEMGDDPGASPGAPIFVTQWVWESSPNTVLTTFAVPEPTGLALGAAAIALVGLRRRRRI